MAAIIKIESLKKSFTRTVLGVGGKKQENNYVLNNLDFNIQKGKITGLIGSNGAGKSTLLNILSRLIDFEQGRITFFANDKNISLSRKRPHQLADLGIGRLFQGVHIFEEMSILDNMLVADDNKFGEFPFAALLHFRKNQKVEQQRIEKARKIYTRFFGEDNYFWENRNDLAKNLSYGQQRLLGLLRLFMNDYRLVLLDEPAAGINPGLMDKILEIIRSMVMENGMTVLLVEHNMEVIRKVADNCAFMSEGKIILTGTPEEVLNSSLVKNTYLGN